MKKILFIINPISGVGKQKLIERLIETELDKNKFIVSVEYTKAAKHAIEISKNAVGKYDIVVAVGGDGSINEVAKGLVDTDIPMGIIPTGSGNGLARYLDIPLKPKKAIHLLNSAEVRKIDTISINDELSVNVSGIGFDAHIAHLFAEHGKRGPLSYVKIVKNEFRSYKSVKYTLEVDGVKIEKDVFLISFANSSQFGNNAYIAPEAQIDDGLIDICFLQKFPILNAPDIALRLFLKKINNTKYNYTLKGRSIKVYNSGEIKAHVDGEPVVFNGDLTINIKPLSLNVIISK